MIITVFCKNRTDDDGKPYKSYLTKLKYADGTEKSVTVHFTGDCRAPKGPFPYNIEATKNIDFNKSRKRGINSNGEIVFYDHIYINNYKDGPLYEDHSCDDLAD